MPNSDSDSMTSTTSRSYDLVAAELRDALGLFPISQLDEATLRLIRQMEADNPIVFALSAEQQAVAREERFVPGAAGDPDVRVLLYTPPGGGAERPAFLHIHGGGFVRGVPEQSDLKNRMLASTLGCIVASVDYRRAPETRFPGALEDCYAVLAWLHGSAQELGICRSRVAVGGESAGGGHAAALGHLARDRGEFPICLQLLDSPMLDDRTGAGADAHPICGEFIWTAQHNRFGWQALLGTEAGGDGIPPLAAPARADSMAGLPPAFIAVGALDLFLEEDMEYARRLIRAGVPTEFHVIPGAYHGFTAIGAGTPQAEAVRMLSYQALQRAFDRSAADAPRNRPIPDMRAQQGPAR